MPTMYHSSIPLDSALPESMEPSMCPANGRWGYAAWIDHQYQKPPFEVLGLDCARHVALTRVWLAHFETHHITSR